MTKNPKIKMEYLGSFYILSFSIYFKDTGRKTPSGYRNLELSTKFATELRDCAEIVYKK